MEEGTLGVHRMAWSSALGLKGGMVRSPSSSACPPPPRTVFPIIIAAKLSTLKELAWYPQAATRAVI